MNRRLWIPLVLATCFSCVAVAAPRNVFEDSFDERLGDGWSWLRENPSAWRLRDGALEIRVEPGVAHNVKNALVRAAPDRMKSRHAIDVTVTNTALPTQQYEQAGITWYNGGRPVFKIVKERIDGELYIIPGKIPMDSRSVQLRLVVSSDGYHAQFRPDGKGEFRTAAKGKLPAPKDDQVSIQCYNGPPDAEHWIRFDDFRILDLDAPVAPATPAAPADLPFLHPLFSSEMVVQLANFMEPQKGPAEGGWALLRGAQFLTARADPQVGLAVAIDIGEARDIHPRNKQDVGRRLALSALDNWHQWRGPNADGFAPRGDPPLEWDDQKNVRWRVEIPGEGASTPIVWDDRIFVLSAIQTERKAQQPPPVDPRRRTTPPPFYFRFVVLCVDRPTGRVVWNRTAREEVPHEGRHPTHTYASSSPTTDGEYLYASFGSRGIYCYDLEGELRWERDLGDMRTRFGWGEAISPALHGDRVIVNWDHEDDSFIAALDARTGKTVWKVKRDEPSSWGTPRIVEHRGRTQVIVNGTNRVRSYDLADGGVIWECGGQTEITISSPVILDDLAICMSGYRGSLARAVSLDSTGDLTDTDRIVWSHTRGTPYVPSPILHGERLFFTGTNGNVMTVLDARSGKPLAEPRRLPGLAGNLYASPVGAADRIYFVDRDGTTVVIRSSPELEVLATNRLGEPVDASPAIVGKQLFLRGKRHLYCLEN